MRKEKPLLYRNSSLSVCLLVHHSFTLLLRLYCDPIALACFRDNLNQKLDIYSSANSSVYSLTNAK